MIRAAARRTAFVAALVGLLAALSGTSPATAVPSPVAHASAVVRATSHAVSALTTGVAGDAVRTTTLVAARTTGVDRAPSPHPGAGVAVLLLVLAAGCLSLGLRPLRTRGLLTELASCAAPRGPPACARLLP